MDKLNACVWLHEGCKSYLTHPTPHLLTHCMITTSHRTKKKQNTLRYRILRRKKDILNFFHHCTNIKMCSRQSCLQLVFKADKLLASAVDCVLVHTALIHPSYLREDQFEF